MTFAVFLDLYRVLADPQDMERQYRQRMAEILLRDYAVPLKQGLKVHDESFTEYQREGEILDMNHDRIGDGDSWVRALNDFEANNITRIFEMLGLSPPEERHRFAARFEEEIVLGANALYPDVRSALKRLKDDGHRIYLSTNASRSNGESALLGGGIRDMFDGVVVMEVAKSKKDRPYYWRKTFEFARIDPIDAVVVDDIARYLEPAAKMGARCYQMIRPKFSLVIEKDRWPVIESLAVLPDILKNP